MKRIFGGFLLLTSVPFGLLATDAIKVTTHVVRFQDDLSTIAIALLFAIILTSGFLGLAATGMLFLTKK